MRQACSASMLENSPLKVLTAAFILSLSNFPTAQRTKTPTPDQDELAS